jgi:type IV pilus assembly protein PilF
MSRRPALALVGALAATVLLLAGGCASPPADGGDIRTASDQTSADRRARVRLELASAYFARGQTTTALDEVKLAIAAKPDLADAFGLRGLIYASLGELQLADESFRRALELAPRDGDVMHNYGWFLCQQQRFDEADRLFTRALAQPQYREPVRSLLAQGVCQARAGRLEEAERTLLRSFELDPASPVTAYNLAEVLMRRGEFERARFYIRRVNAREEQANAQSLWLAARIESRLGNRSGVEESGRLLRQRFPQSNEAALYERGQFGE